MKTTLIAIILAMTTQFAAPQSKSDKMYDTFSNKDGITSFTFSKNMIDAINIDFGDEGDEKKVKGDLHQVRFMSYNPEKGNLRGYEFIDKAIGFLPGTAYHKIENNEPDDDAEIWVSGGKKNFNECHVFIRNENETGTQFVVSFYGNFTVNDLEKLKKSGKDFSEN